MPIAASVTLTESVHDACPAFIVRPVTVDRAAARRGA
jgi:hypothetical protein